MITRITRHQYLKGLGALERGDIDAVRSHSSILCATLTFVGDTPLGAQLLTGS